MKHYNLVIKNIKKSFKDYLIYFLTLVLSVAIFYVFNAVESQTIMMSITQRTYDIIKLMVSMLNATSVFVAIILGFLIVYASNFLIKRRNKEFGIYLILGMPKKDVSKILLLETIIIALFSLIVGLLIGVVLSQFMSLLVVAMFEIDMTSYQFVFSFKAAIKTIIYFVIMFIVVMIFNTITINRLKIIDLINANARKEKNIINKPWLHLVIFILAIALLAFAYDLVTNKVKVINEQNLVVPITCGIIGTFLFFYGLAGIVLFIRKFRKCYFHNLNSFTINQLTSKINTNVISMSIICLLLFLTICILGSSFTLKNSMIANIDSLVPCDLQLVSFNNDNYLSVEKILEDNDFNTNNLQNKFIYNAYRSDDIKVKDTFGYALDTLQKDYPFIDYEAKVDIYKLSDYNQLAKMFNLPLVDIAIDEYAFIADYKTMVDIYNSIFVKEVTLNYHGNILKLAYGHVINGFTEISSTHINTGIIVINDELIDENDLYANFMVANYQNMNKKDIKDYEKNIDDLIQKIVQAMSYSSKQSILESSLGLGGLVSFVGIYLGLIFLISSCALLSLKQLSETSDSIRYYVTLQDLGTSYKDIKKSLLYQMLAFFGLPLLLAIIHSYFGFRFAMYILATFGLDKLLFSIMIASIIILSIYGIYFMVTYLSAKNIVKQAISR